MSFFFSQSPFTKVITGEIFETLPEYGITVLVIELISGTGSFAGTRRVGLLESVGISLIIGDPVTISVEGLNYLSDISVTADGGSAIKIIAR